MLATVSSCAASYDQSPTNMIMQNWALGQPNSTESSTVFRKQILSLILICQKLAAFGIYAGPHLPDVYADGKHSRMAQSICTLPDILE